MKIGLFFGSFNPVHTGHLLVASYITGFTDIEKVWMVVSPQNPFKPRGSLANIADRLEMVRLATNGSKSIEASDAELHLPLPSYTVDTLSFLTGKYPEHDFSLIMGADTVSSLPGWKDHTKILENFHVYVYPRSGYDLSSLSTAGKLILTNTPLVEVSSTFIRDSIRKGKNMQYWVPEPVLDYISRHSLFLEPKSP